MDERESITCSEARRGGRESMSECWNKPSNGGARQRMLLSMRAGWEKIRCCHHKDLPTNMRGREGTFHLAEATQREDTAQPTTVYEERVEVYQTDRCDKASRASV